MCGARPGGVTGVDVTNEAVIQGVVTRDGAPVSPAYVRLLDSGGDFTAEVPTSDDGEFRFFAAPGSWTVRVLAPGTSVDYEVEADNGEIAEIVVHV
jgi:hypothetical protein